MKTFSFFQILSITDHTITELLVWGGAGAGGEGGGGAGGGWVHEVGGLN